MIPVSDAWKEAHEQMILPESFVEISMAVANMNASASFESLGEASFSKSNNVLNNLRPASGRKSVFLESNFWILDGSMHVGSDSLVDGVVGFVSQEDGLYGLSGLFISLDQVGKTPIPGLTITWSSLYNTYATDFYVAIFDENDEVTTVSVSKNTSAVSFIELPLTNYKFIEIWVNEWCLPQQRVRIDSVLLGQKITFGKNEIISYTHEQSGSPLGTEITKNTIEFSVDNSDNRWNPMNPVGFAKYLSERQRVTVNYGLQTSRGVEWIQAGVFYLTEWRAPSDGIAATFSARDGIGFMENTKYSRQYIAGATNKSTPVYSSKEDVIYGDTPIDTISSGTAVDVCEKSILIAHGSDVDNPESSGWMTYRIKQGWVNADDVSIYYTPSLQLEIMQARQSTGFTPDRSDWGEEVLNNAGPISFDEITVDEFIQKCVASCGYTMWQSADGTLHFNAPSMELSDYVVRSEMEYSYPEVELTKPLRQVDVLMHYNYHPATKTVSMPVGDVGETITVDCPFLWANTSRASDVAQRYVDWWSPRELVSGDFRADPRLELFDVITVESKYGEISPVMITYLKYTYNGCFRAAYEGKVIVEDDGFGGIEWQ